MKRYPLKQPIFLAVACLVGAILMLSRPAALAALAAPLAQPTPFPTPTPGADGRIVYVVKEEDTLWRIAAIAGITLEELMALNGIQPGDYINPGMQLVLGTAGPVVPTADVERQATESQPTASPTPVSGTGDICVLLFQDENGNASLDEAEGPIVGGQLSVVNVEGELAGEVTTDSNPEGHCFSDLVNGDYNVSAAVPEAYNPTTSMNLPVRLQPGDTKYVQFGAQPSGVSPGAGASASSGRSTLLGLLGVFLLVAAGFLGYVASRFRRDSPRSLR
jgi:LysM repeat protein